MTKKNREKFFATVRRNAESLVPQSMSAGEVREALEQAGCDTARLRQRLYESAKKLQIDQRIKGRKVPRYLDDLVDLTSPLESGAKNSEIALAKAERWIDGFMHPPVMDAGPINVMRAYRKSGDLTANDSRVLDELEDKLKKAGMKGKG